ncbi:OB-fold nucleic acid binding domain-containing protein [Methanobacterium aggregans]|uniref:OB-fold nucleic acid binding domain-containing protein n=1 Tax=Methanobacterium aggregans TaxID=1615586 RepID=UPI001AE7A4C1|nr:OB-fold nucleic acid binding domain-containing protein [Methanobacterium aggregans]MBP2046962.1 DNA/RNA endonuclease YhcR with UshA esterase domain [Methanobacterium aggregans]
MEDHQIFKLALATSIIGLLGMVIFAGQVMPREVKISQIDRGMLDEDVAVEGVVQKVGKSKTSNTYFIKVMDGTGEITLVIFDSSATDIEKGNLTIQGMDKRRINAVGTVSEYRGSMEIILKDAKSLRIVS